jgi:transposase
MRGEFRDQGGLFSYIDPESRIAADHPLRQVRGLVRAVLKGLSGSFSRLYSHEGRPSIPPEQLLSALLLQVLYGLRCSWHSSLNGLCVVSLQRLFLVLSLRMLFR